MFIVIFCLKDQEPQFELFDTAEEAEAAVEDIKQLPDFDFFAVYFGTKVREGGRFCAETREYFY